jgi:uncharacterized protein YndB with AHSA1/START domain
MHFEITVDIDASPETVWRILADIETWPEWTTESMRSVRRLDRGEFTIGSRAEVRQPRLLATIWTVTELIPGRSFTWRATSPGVTATASHEVIDRTGLVTVCLVIDQAGSLGWLFGRATARLTRRYLELESHGLKQRAESGQGEHPLDARPNDL